MSDIKPGDVDGFRVHPITYINYADAEALCMKLATQLRTHLGEEIAQCGYVAIPRGGYIVLGMLSYVLNISRHQIHSDCAHTDAECVVVVDDCSLSGARFSAILERLPAKRIVFAHLCSTPDLRRAIVKDEPRVEAVLSATDLVPVKSLAERSRREIHDDWQQRHPTKRYLMERTLPISFSWSEPDRVLWNEREDRFEDHWHRVPPHRCLDARAALDIPFSAPAFDEYGLPDGIWWKVDDDAVTLWNARIDEVFLLRDVAGLMWRTLVGFGSFELAVDHLMGAYEIEETVLLRDLEAFVVQLIENGLLVQATSERGTDEPCRILNAHE